MAGAIPQTDNPEPEETCAGIKNEDYFFKESESSVMSTEIDRLNLQHQYLKTILGYKDILELPLDISKATQDTVNILDVAAGTGSWILDVARIPEVRSRLSPPSIPNTVHLYACDISDAKFPGESIKDSSGVNFFLQDITKPFPENMKGKFDLVHMAMLVWALTKDGWEAALQNIYDILKPGGYIIVMDYDMGIIVPPEQTLPGSSGDIRDPNTYFTSNPASFLNEANALVVDTMGHVGFLIGLSQHLSDMLRVASFKPISSKVASVYYGPAIMGKTGLGGKSLEPYADSALMNFSMALDAISKVALSQSHLELPKGSEITTEEDRKGVRTRILEGVMNEGCSHGISEWIAQKPI